MKGVLDGKRFAGTGFELDIEFQQDDGTPITTKTLSFSGAITDLTMDDIKARVQREADRLQRILDLNEDPDTDIGTDLLA